MKYREIKLNVSTDVIKRYKLFEGIKLYSDAFLSEDRKSVISKRVYVTKKHNYVYYERADVNWNYWNDKTKSEWNFNTHEVERHIIFEIASDLNQFIPYLGVEIIENLILKEQHGEIVERLDI